MKPMMRGGPVFVIEENDTWETFYNSLQSYRDQLVDKWMWLIEGTHKQKLPPIREDLYPKMAMLFENQEALSKGIIHEATMTTDITMPQTYSLGIIRKTYPNLFAMEVCSVQPMPLTSGGVAQIFYLDHFREDVTPNVSITIPDSDYAVNVENGVPKRVKMTVTSGTVTATKDILAATWSSEAMEDARGTLGINIEGEMITLASREITQELDERVMWQMVAEAGAGNTNWDPDVPAGAVYPPKEHYETLGHAVVEAEDDIFGYRYHGADYIVCGRAAAVYMRKTQGFKPTTPNNPKVGRNFSYGIHKIGEVEGQGWDVYLSPYSWMSRLILVGCRPRSDLDTGYIFAPYIPLTPMPLVYAEFKPYDDATLPGAYVNTDKWSRNIRTRNAKKMVVPELFATVTVLAETP